MDGGSVVVVVKVIVVNSAKSAKLTTGSDVETMDEGGDAAIYFISLFLFSLNFIPYPTSITYKVQASKQPTIKQPTYVLVEELQVL